VFGSTIICLASPLMHIDHPAKHEPSGP
jgi:hypothetical protein